MENRMQNKGGGVFVAVRKVTTLQVLGMFNVFCCQN
jgi:hypothetical protein